MTSLFSHCLATDFRVGGLAIDKQRRPNMAAYIICYRIKINNMLYRSLHGNDIPGAKRSLKGLSC